MISLQTNVNSLVAQDNLSVTQKFQSQTIQRLTSGYRINSSGDDAGGLAIANQLRSDIAELAQGVRNANDGVSQLQIADGGLNDISQMLDRMKTLATQSATTTFTGDRSTLNNEYQQLISEITREASNIGLNSGGQLNAKINVYIGGGRTSNQSGSSQISIDLSGGGNAVDATSLNLNTTSIIGGGSGFGTNNLVTNLSDSNALFNVGTTNNNTTFTINYADASGNVQSANVVIAGSAGGVSGSAFVAAVNSALATQNLSAISAQVGPGGDLQFSGGNLLSVGAAVNGVTQAPVTTGTSLINGANYQATGAFTAFTAGSSGAASETMNLTVGGTNYALTLTSATTGSQAADTIGHAVTSLNAQLKGSGVYAVQNGGGITLESVSSFTAAETANMPNGTSGAGSFFGTTIGAETVTAPTTSASSTGNAQNGIAAINAAVKALGLVQGKVGAGENKLIYAIQLAQSQISNFSAAQSQIRDADIAAEAANLTKAQVLQQSSIAAMAQANSAPQTILKLLQG